MTQVVDHPDIIETVVARRRTRWMGAVGVVALVAISSGWIGLRVGQNHRPAVRWHTGFASSMPEQIAAEADGLAFRIPIDVAWFDSKGSYHDGGRPSCVSEIGHIDRVRFAETEVDVRGFRSHQVVAVSCAA